MQQTARQPFKRHTGGHCARAVSAGVRAVGIENLHAKNAASAYEIYASSYQNRSNYLPQVEGSLEVNPALHQAKHGISVEYLERDIAEVESARSRETSRSQSQQPSSDKPASPEKAKQTRKGRTR